MRPVGDVNNGHTYIYIVYIHMIIRNHIDTHVNIIKLCTYDIKQL